MSQCSEKQNAFLTSLFRPLLFPYPSSANSSSLNQQLPPSHPQTNTVPQQAPHQTESPPKVQNEDSRSTYTPRFPQSFHFPTIQMPENHANSFLSRVLADTPISTIDSNIPQKVSKSLAGSASEGLKIPDHTSNQTASPDIPPPRPKRKEPYRMSLHDSLALLHGIEMDVKQIEEALEIEEANNESIIEAALAYADEDYMDDRQHEPAPRPITRSQDTPDVILLEELSTPKHSTSSAEQPSISDLEDLKKPINHPPYKSDHEERAYILQLINRVQSFSSRIPQCLELFLSQTIEGDALLYEKMKVRRVKRLFRKAFLQSFESFEMNLKLFGYGDQIDRQFSLLYRMLLFAPISEASVERSIGTARRLCGKFRTNLTVPALNEALLGKAIVTLYKLMNVEQN